MPRRICTMPPAERTAHLRAIVRDLDGHEVLIAFDTMRRHDEAKTIRGRLVGVAAPLTGATADVVIVRATFGADLFAISSATVLEIHEL